MDIMPSLFEFQLIFTNYFLFGHTSSGGEIIPKNPFSKARL